MGELELFEMPMKRLLSRVLAGSVLLGVCLLPCELFSAESAPEVSNFALLDHQGKMHELRRMEGKAVVLYFTANGCPVVRQSIPKLKVLREKLAAKGVSLLLVNSSTGDDRTSINREAMELHAWHLPVLEDESQGVARHLGVTRTGHAVAISTADWKVFYQGALDDQMVEGAQKPAATEHYLEAAVDAFLAGKPIAQAKTVARGCRIQFDAGEEPDSAPVSYSKTIAPLLQQKCVSCHSPGNIGSWSMSQYKKVKSMASMIEETLLTRRMPPWDPDPHYGTFISDPSLTASEKQTLLRWIHQGAPRGDGPDPLEGLVVEAQSDWPLGKPDLILRLPKPETVPASGVLDYRHIEVVAGNAKDAWVGGYYVRPGNKKVVHHVIARLKQGGYKDNLGQKETFVGWAPGTTQARLPEGTGKYLPANARFDFEMHYTPNGAEQTDQTEIGLYFLPGKPSRRFESVPVVNTAFEIKPGDPDSQTQAMYGFKKPATLYGVTPHMHLRGKWMKFEALYPNGKREVLCSVPRYDFNWQQTYRLKEPRKLPAGTWIVLTGGYDNSSRNPANPDATKTVHWGDQSFDEMFLGYYNVAWEPEPEQRAEAR